MNVPFMRNGNTVLGRRNRMINGVKRSCCPRCGGKIEVSDLFQYTLNYVVCKSGKLSKRYRKYDNGSIDTSLAACINGCGVLWEDGEFWVEADGSFVDLKYKKEEQDG